MCAPQPPPMFPKACKHKKVFETWKFRLTPMFPQAMRHEKPPNVRVINPSCNHTPYRTTLSCPSPCVFCCISRNFAFGGRSVTHLMGHGTMSRLMFGLIKATQPPHKMRERMRQMRVCVCVCYAVRSAPPSQFVVSARTNIVKNVLMHTLVGNKLFIRQYMMDTH